MTLVPGHWAAGQNTPRTLPTGLESAVNANFGAGQIKINGMDVAPTNSADDQYSVLDISAAGTGAAGGAALSTGFTLVHQWHSSECRLVIPVR